MTTISILGGTGALGSGLALRWAEAGHSIILGTRDRERGLEVAAQLMEVSRQRGRSALIEVDSYEVAAATGDILAMTVRFAHHGETLAVIQHAAVGKILIDTTVPLMLPKVMRVQLPSAGSAGQIAQATLGEDVRVVSAFQNVAANHLHADGPIGCDVVVTGDDKAARETVIGLARDAGMKAFHGGSIANSAAAEALTSILIFMNKEYGGHAGIRMTGIEPVTGGD